MPSNYKPIGDYIQKLKVRNSEDRYSELLGINIDKFFMPSVANVVGTNLSRYLIVEPGQFACNRMHVGRDYRIPVALSEKEKPFIVSPAYDVFEIMDTSILLPEYLMMWFRRAEFDRNAWFYTDADVRGGLAWDAFCSIELPVPSIEKQREIVREYNVVKNRLKLNEEINQKLEDTAQALYKHWFIDFEFPNDEGEPYKSSGGKMVYNEELDKEIPERWVVKHLGDISNCLDNRRKPLSKEERAVRQGTVPYYGAMSIVDYIDDYIYDGDYLLFSEDGANIIDENGYPALQYVSGKFWLNNHSHILEGTKEISIQFLFNALSKINVSDIVTGAAQPKINQHNMNSIRILTATTLIHQNFNKLVISGYELVKYNIKEIHLLTVLQAVLLSKMSLVEENKLSKMNMVL